MQMITQAKGADCLHAHCLNGRISLMNSRKIIADAWLFTRENKNLMWAFGFVPAIVETLIGILYLMYQFFSFKRSPLFENAPHSFLTEVITATVNFLNDHANFWIPFIIITIIVLILYALLPTLLQGGLIQVIAKKKMNEEISITRGISLAFLVFLPLLEYHLLVKSFSVFSLLTEAAFILRNLGTGAMEILLPVFILAVAIGLILTLLFTYSEFFVVLKKKPVLSSMGRSAKLVILSWQHTFLIAILMMIIGLRVVFNIIAVLLVPALLFVSAGLLATVALAKAGIVIGVVMSFIGLFVASYFTGILHIFANAVWTFTFLELMDEASVKEHFGE